MPKKDLTLTSKIILALHIAEDMMMPFMFVRDLRKRALLGGDYDSFRAIIYRLKQRGLLKFIKYKDERFVQLTSKGQLEALLLKARIPEHKTWDGKWRLIIFDIPEEARIQRDMFRRILKMNKFILFQKSVFVSPYPLNRSAIDYLKQTKLIDYIRILRIDEMDEESDLRKKFGL